MKKNNNSYKPEFNVGLTEEEINSPEFNPDDFAPAPDSSSGADNEENERMINKRNSLVFASVVALLALIISLLGWMTFGAVEKNRHEAFQKEIISCLSNCDRAEKYEHKDSDYDVYALFFRNKIAGYCVHTLFDGYGGNIEMLVAFNSDNLLANIVILDHNESYGLGNKITSKEFLSQFNGLLIGSSEMEYDIISGATVSANAVADEIRKIVELGISTASIARELGYETISAEEIEEEIEKEESQGNNPDGTDNDTAETTGRPSDPSRPGDHQGGQNVNDGGDDDMGIESTEGTTVYETESKDPESDTTSEPETTEKVEDTTVADTTDDTTADTSSGEDTTGKPSIGGGNDGKDTGSAEDTTNFDTADTDADLGDDTTQNSEDTGDAQVPIDNSQADLEG